MKKHFYFFTKGKLFRRNNTIYFIPDDDIPPSDDENLQDDILLSSLEPKSIVDSAQRTIIPINEIDSIFIFADVHFNSRFLEFASANHIPIHLFNHFGRYKGTFYPINESFSGTFILKQSSFYLKHSRRMFLARNIVDGAAHNIIKNIARYSNNSPELQDAIAQIKLLASNLGKAIYTSQLMGIEAQIRKIYYSTFNHFINSEIRFTKREFHPPTDPMNSLISFANALVYSAVISEIYRTQLNPFISFLHEPGDNRFSLAYDIAEIFKPFLADRLIFKLLNNKSIRLEHFHYLD
ncbi:MAG: CRISPR-associated endonuclease Cas1 [Candidatus Kapaibacteriota bacterium]